jgi:hypothetical protein
MTERVFQVQLPLQALGGKQVAGGGIAQHQQAGQRKAQRQATQLPALPPAGGHPVSA